MAPHLGTVVCDQSIAQKLTQRRNLPFELVRQELEWPAVARVKWHEHPEHGRRLAADIRVDGRRVAAFLLPLPEWDENSTTWVLKTAYWVEG